MPHKLPAQHVCNICRYTCRRKDPDIKKHSNFWNKPRIQKAVEFVEAWAIVHKYQQEGGKGIPMEKLDPRTSRSSPSNPSDTPSLFDAKVTVDNTLKEMQNPKILIEHLLWKYPSTGKYSNEETTSTFRPSSLKQFAKEFGWHEERINEILVEDEKNFLIRLSKRI